LRIPALRERGVGDIERLFRHFHAEAAAGLGGAAKPLGHIRDVLVHAWPGNVRELRNAAERAALGFPPVSGAAGATHAATAEAPRTLAERMMAYERHELETALARGMLLQEVAAQLGISRKTLYLKLREHGLRSSESHDM